MRKALWVLCLSALLLPAALAAAQTAFDGTWKIDMNKVDFPKKPDVYLLQNDTYECKTCVPRSRYLPTARTTASPDIPTTIPWRSRSSATTKSRRLTKKPAKL
jgi:hypothetical protein